MLDEATFRRNSDDALESLKQSLIAAEDASGAFEFEDNNGVMNIIFEDGSSKFVVTPNTPVRQIWISAVSTSFKLEWSDSAAAFALSKTGEDLKTLTSASCASTCTTPPSPSKAKNPHPHHDFHTPECPKPLKSRIAQKAKLNRCSIPVQ